MVIFELIKAPILEMLQFSLLFHVTNIEIKIEIEKFKLALPSSVICTKTTKLFDNYLNLFR